MGAVANPNAVRTGAVPAVDVHFGAGSATIPEDECAGLDRLAALCTQGQASTIVLVGHSDERGDPRKSLQLSLGRATAAMEAVVA